MNRWTQTTPIWVSRPTSDGWISYFSVPLWLLTLIGFVLLLNVTAWGFIGLYEAGRVIF